MPCEHTRKNIVWSTVNSAGEPFEGGKQLRHQCADCGKLLANHLAHRLATPSTSNIDLAALKRFNEEREREWRERWGNYQAERDAERERRREVYQAYLETPEWWGKRELVIERADGLCEGCRSAEAVHVHHLTYKHCGNEFLWELVAICRECHERVHGREFED